MSIRFRRYKFKNTEYLGHGVMAIKVTLKNIPELVAHICTRGGAATGHTGNTSSKRPARIRLKQFTFGPGWSKRDWRVAAVGDYIVRLDDGDYSRVKAKDFEREYKLA